MVIDTTSNGALNGQKALVTGACRGIGLAIARALAREGADVMLTARSADELDRAAREINDAGGGRAVAEPADLADDATPARLAARCVECLGGLTILVNNAGIGLYGPLETATPEQWDVTMRVNARAPLFLAQAALAPMRAAGGGVIVNVASVVGVKGYVNQGLYTASKHAMMGWTNVFAQEVQKDGIRVHAICPGGVATEMAQAARPDLAPEGLMRPEEIAGVIVFLLGMRGNAVIDEVHLRRAGGAPWF